MNIADQQLPLRISVCSVSLRVCSHVGDAVFCNPLEVMEREAEIAKTNFRNCSFFLR